MIGVVIIAIKIIMKNGKDMSRELLGINFQSTKVLPSVYVMANVESGLELSQLNSNSQV
jgi:hypothetical protein